MADNIRYTAGDIEQFYREHRVTWEQFYESERVMFERLGLNAESTVLDLGCGCGGLGLALKERFGVTDYTGVEINEQATETGRVLYPEACMINADVLAIPADVLPHEQFDVVVSLSCIDWNLRFLDMLETAYSYVKPGGWFLSSFRLTTEATSNDIQQSWQYINFDGKKEGEIAPYVVMNARELIELLRSLQHDTIAAYGYWGNPSTTAETPHEKICFTVAAVKKAADGVVSSPIENFQLPNEVLASLS